LGIRTSQRPSATTDTWSAACARLDPLLLKQRLLARLAWLLGAARTRASALAFKASARGAAGERMGCGAAGQPFGAGFVYPSLEVFRDESKGTFPPANADRGDAACSGCLIQPGSRDTKLGGDLGRLKKVGRADLLTAHMIIDGEASKASM
jgi:hypothetical protein